MILLDTNAFIWLDGNHARARKLGKVRTRLAISPASILELQFLIEQGRLRLKRASSIEELVNDRAWTLDEPPAAAWYDQARALSWTRDPFNRLIAGHALYRGWKLATADEVLLEHLPGNMIFEL